jgi:hypothetical protein
VTGTMGDTRPEADAAVDEDGGVSPPSAPRGVKLFLGGLNWATTDGAAQAWTGGR